MPELSIRQLLCTAALVVAAPSQAALVATFDNLPFPPALDSATTIQWTNAGNSLEYEGVTWDARFGIVGDQYRVGGTSGPLFGIPHSGHYFVTNHTGASGMMINTDKVLAGAWFGRNQYYGFGEGGADQVTIVAMNGAIELASVVFDLPENNAGLAEPLSWVDTGIFSALGPITGYRIDRRELGSQNGNWVADDFTFVDATQLDAPGAAALLLAGLAGMLAALKRRSTISR